MSSSFQDIDKIREQSERYIKAWQKAQEALEGKTVPFDALPIGAKFTLPGGRCQQVKLSCKAALAGGMVVTCWPWERVAPV